MCRFQYPVFYLEPLFRGRIKAQESLTQKSCNFYYHGDGTGSRKCDAERIGELCNIYIIR